MARAIGRAQNVDLNSASEQDLESVGGLGRERAHPKRPKPPVS